MALNRRRSAPPSPAGFDKLGRPTKSLWSLLRPWLWRLAVGGALLLLVTYGAAVAVVYVRAAIMPDNQLRWHDVALAPIRWKGFREKQGRGLCALGLRQLDLAQYSESYFNLKAGLARAPREAKARLALARLSASFDVRLAEELLETGLKLEPDHAELNGALLELDRQFGAFDRVLDLAARATELPAASAARKVRILEAAELQGDLGRHGEALALLGTLGGEVRGDPEVVRATVRSLIGAGRAEEARGRFDAEGAGLAELDRMLLECELAVAEHDDEGLQSLLRRLPSVHPDGAQASIVAYYTWHQRGRHTLRERVGEDFIRLHAGEAEALRRFGALLVTLNEPATLLQFIGYVEAQGGSSFDLQVLLTEHALRQGRFDDAFRVLQKWEPTLARFKRIERSYPEFIRRLTRGAFDVSSAHATLLDGYLAGLPRPLAYPRFLLAMEVLEKAGMRESAALVGDLARRTFPMSDEIARRVTEMAAALNRQRHEEAARLAVAAAAREQRFANREATEAQVARLVAEGSYQSALTVIRELREAKPAWLEGRAGEIAFRKLQIDVLAGEPAAARDALRSYLRVRRAPVDSLRLLEWATELEKQSRPEIAQRVRDEVAFLGRQSDSVASALGASEAQEGFRKTADSMPRSLAALDEALENRDPDQVVRQIAMLRKLAPPWLEQGGGHVAVREIQARLMLKERPAAAIVLRALVRQQPRQAAQVQALVRELARQGEHDDALFLVTALLAERPDDAEARALQGALVIRAPL